jgi:hypothetical protein
MSTTANTEPLAHSAQLAQNSQRYLAMEDHVRAVRAAYVLLHPLLDHTRDLGGDHDICIGWLSSHLGRETEALLAAFEGRTTDEDDEAIHA